MTSINFDHLTKRYGDVTAVGNLKMGLDNIILIEQWRVNHECTRIYTNNIRWFLFIRCTCCPTSPDDQTSNYDLILILFSLTIHNFLSIFSLLSNLIIFLIIWRI
jgi:hypothetical protein